MGACNTKAIPVPPGKEKLVGTWVSSPGADKMKVDVVNGYRYKKGVFEGLQAPDGEWEAVKLTIEDSGKLHYVHVASKPGAGFASSVATLIDLPAKQWTHKEILLPRHAPSLEYSLDEDTDTLIVNGTRLRRSGAAPGGSEATMRVVVDGNRDSVATEDGGKAERKEEERQAEIATVFGGSQDIQAAMQMEVGTEGGEAAKEGGGADGGDAGGQQDEVQEGGRQAETEAKEEGGQEESRSSEDEAKEDDGQEGSSADRDGDTKVVEAEEAAADDGKAAKEDGEQEGGNEEAEKDGE